MTRFLLRMLHQVHSQECLLCLPPPRIGFHSQSLIHPIQFRYHLIQNQISILLRLLNYVSGRKLNWKLFPFLSKLKPICLPRLIVLMDIILDHDGPWWSKNRTYLTTDTFGSRGRPRWSKITNCDHLYGCQLGPLNTDRHSRLIPCVFSYWPHIKTNIML